MSFWKRIFGRKDTQGWEDELDQWLHDENASDTVQIYIPELTRNMLYDLGHEDPEGAMKTLGYTAQSDEGVQMSERDSEERLNEVVEVAQIAFLMVDTVMEAVDNTLVLDNIPDVIGDTEVTEEVLEEALEHRRLEVKAVTLAVLSSLADHDLIRTRQELIVKGMDE